MNQEDLELLGIEYKKSDLYKQHSKENNEQLKIRKNFVEKRFNLERLSTMQLDDYVEGKGSKVSFCYLIEFGMQCLGQIRGSFANSKFVIHYSEEIQDYSFQTGKFGSNIDDIFNNVKNEIIKLINAGNDDDLESLENNKLSPMFRGKIYYVYYPEKTLPVYNEDHIDFFMKNMGICFNKNIGYFSKIKLMMKWKNQSDVFKSFSNLDFMRFMYSSYAFEKDINILKGKDSIKKDIKNIEVELITDKDVIDRVVKCSTKSHRKPNFEEINRKKTALGLNGEKFVYEYEKNNNKKYFRKIKMVGNDPSYGFDIISYDVNGNEKHIEVKTCSTGNINKVDFYITSNEYSKLLSDPIYVIYYVCGLFTKKPKIIVLGKENLSEVTFEPIAYKIMGKVDI